MAEKIVKEIDFINDLNLTVLKSKSFRVFTDFFIMVKGQLIEILSGFETDLASVPRIPIFYTLLAEQGEKSAVLHDFLYQKNYYGRSECDRIFELALKEEGIGWFKRKLFYAGVRAGGAKIYAFYGQVIKEQQELMKAREKEIIELTLAPLEGDINETRQQDTSRELSIIYTGWEGNTP